ncbi:hypothetical protein TNCV_1663461 [Trichonephila clavipes]|nr:hypothetical protein TNCV_1663461 [Trichonephila clavipes]
MSMVDCQYSDATLQPDCVVFTCVSESAQCLRLLPIPWIIKCVMLPVFFNAKNIKPVEIYHQPLEIYGENVMSDGMVRRKVKQFNDACTSVHDEAACNFGESQNSNKRALNRNREKAR